MAPPGDLLCLPDGFTLHLPGRHNKPLRLFTPKSAFCTVAIRFDQP